MSRKQDFDLAVIGAGINGAGIALHAALRGLRVIVLDHGRIAVDGPARQVLGDPALLQSAGLEAPPAVQLLHALRQRGWDLSTDGLSLQEAVSEIARAYKTRENT